MRIVALTPKSRADTSEGPGVGATHTALCGATSGNVQDAHFTPDEAGTWTWKASFRTGNEVSVRDPDNGTPTGFDGAEGSFDVAPTDKSGRDFRTKGMVRYVGGHHLRHAGTGEYYLKGGADSPENLLGYEDFDGTRDLGGLSTPGLPNGPHTFAPQVDNWRSGDPTRDGGLGKGLVGALNHLGSGG